MVVKMMKWRPWPPLVTKKFEVKMVVKRMEGWDLVREGAAATEKKDKEKSNRRLTVEIRWKGPKFALMMSSLRKNVLKRNFTKEVEVSCDEPVVEWDEEFVSLCSLSQYKDNVFHPWEIGFSLFNGLNQGPKNKALLVGTAFLNLAEYASSSEQKEFEIDLPLTLSTGFAEPRPMLKICLSLLELTVAQDGSESMQRSIVLATSPPQSGETSSPEKDEVSAIKAGLRKVKIFTDYVSTRKAKKAVQEGESSDSRYSARSDGEYNYPFESDSLDDFDEGEPHENAEDISFRKSFSYGTLAYANEAGRSFYSSIRINAENEDWVHYSNRRSDVGYSNIEDPTSSISEPTPLQSSKLSILPWRKRKLSFRSPKAKGEPLLKKANAEEGGDDIDFDRRQLDSDVCLSLGGQKVDEDSSANGTSISEFGDDNFSVGSWEQKEITSRDGHMKLQAQVFFASIDQRSEKAAGESACTALVAVIADWFQNNRNLMPIKSQFDSLIREGSLEWRNLCGNEIYRERFPDKHFDLETVLQAKIRPLSVNSGKSFIGFFHPEGMEEGRFDFLEGAMSFDNIWDEITCVGSECISTNEPRVYIVSWNDHFFVLKVEPEAYYIIDTLGERLFEGCSQAYILKFDRNATICKLPDVVESSDEKQNGEQQSGVTTSVEPGDLRSQQLSSNEESSLTAATVSETEESMKSEENLEIVCRGKECCKDYIKSFLAAIPIRELQADIKKGLMTSTPLHHRLQIEFHYTELLQLLPEITAAEAAIATP